MLVLALTAFVAAAPLSGRVVLHGGAVVHLGSPSGTALSLPQDTAFAVTASRKGRLELTIDAESSPFPCVAWPVKWAPLGLRIFGSESAVRTVAAKSFELHGAHDGSQLTVLQYAPLETKDGRLEVELGSRAIPIPASSTPLAARVRSVRKPTVEERRAMLSSVMGSGLLRSPAAQAPAEWRPAKHGATGSLLDAPFALPNDDHFTEARNDGVSIWLHVPLGCANAVVQVPRGALAPYRADTLGGGGVVPADRLEVAAGIRVSDLRARQIGTTRAVVHLRKSTETAGPKARRCFGVAGFAEGASPLVACFPAQAVTSPKPSGLFKLVR